MPFIFTVMLYNMASGLLLYWTASTSLGILEQWLIRRRMAGQEIKPVKEEGDKAKRGKGAGAAPEKPGFFGRMMEAVEEQTRKSQQAQKQKPTKHD